MKNRTELDKLTDQELYSLLLFALYKLVDTPEYSTISELAYMLDKKSLLKLFSYFGGVTIKIPTIAEFQTVVDALLLYEYVNMEDQDFNKSLNEITGTNVARKDAIKKAYIKLCQVLEGYELRKLNDA